MSENEEQERGGTAVTEVPGSAPERVVIARRAAERLRTGHVWVYASDITQVIPRDAANGLTPVYDPSGRLIGTALFSPTSQIALRMVSAAAIGEDAWIQLLRARLGAAIAERLSAVKPGTNACRLAFGEADGLPGIVLDKYADLVVLQLLARGVDTARVRSAVVDVVRAEINPRTIAERPDPRIRELEQLSAPTMTPLYARDAVAVTATEFELNGLTFWYDADAGQKTGAFLDQSENYAAAARHGFGEALDVCTYQGGFALHLARVSQSVTGVDVSQAALEVAERNLARNRAQLGGVEVEWIKADGFDFLRGQSEAGAEYDTIVLDPPAFAKSQRAAVNALRGYKELNLQAFKLLRPGGTLVTCSCSHHVSAADFERVVADAAGDVGRRVRLLERRGAAPAPPVVITIPETEYLKCLILRVE